MSKLPVVTGALAAALLPLSVSFSAADGVSSAGDVVRLNTACAAVGEEGGCSFNLLKICETQHNDHRFYRND